MKSCTATLLALSLVCASAPPAAAQPPAVSEYQVKAAYLVNFARFVEWPADDAAPFAMCVLGADPFGAVLDATVADVTVRGRRAGARRVASPADADGCRVLFISASETTRLEAILTSLDRRAVLTVSDMPQFARRGGMIQFVNDGDRVRFEVDLDPAQAVGLTVSSNLLRVATVVRPAGRPR